MSNASVSRKDTQPFMSVFEGGRCVGFVLCRGPKGFEGYDSNESSLGIFNNKDAAAAAVCAPGG
jgi:hypothetical protein